MKVIRTPVTLKVLLFASLLAITQNAAATIRYVKAGATGTGASWSDASGDLYGMINASQFGDEVWVAEGTYQPPSGQEFVMRADVKIYGGFAGTETTLLQRDLSLHTSKLTRGTTGVVIRNNYNGLSSTALLDGFYITNATQSAVVNISSSPAFANCIFAGNQNFVVGGFMNSFGSRGGAVLNDQYSAPSFTGCAFNNNSAVYGGALFNRNSASPTLINCTFINNSASDRGGCIYSEMSGSPVLNTCTFTGNTANSGAGMYSESSSARLTGCTFTNNNATTNGGGIYSSLSSCILTNCTFKGNAAPNGGGLYNYFSSFRLVNCLLSGNYASYLGGGMYNMANTSSISFTNCTISGNAASNGGGGMWNQASSNITIRNSIIYNNNSGVLYNGYTPTISYSLVQDLTATSNGNISGAIDPLFVNPVSPGKNTGGDYRLQTCSPVVNKGSNSYYAVGQSPDLSAITTDLDGNPRFYNGGTVDMGAYERTGEPVITVDAGGIVYVKPGATGTGESWSCATGNLQAAINTASSGNQVWVAGGTYIPNRRADATGVITTGDRNNAFVLKTDVKIYGGFAGTESSLSDRNLSLTANASILSGDLNGDDNGFTNNSENAYHVVVSAGNMGAALLDGFTIQGGNCDGGIAILINGESVGTNSGGGIQCTNSSPILNNLVIKGNAGRYGAGLALSASSPIITNSFIAGNAGFYGGGIIASNCGASITNVIISGNTAVEQGGGMYNEWSVAPALTNVTIAGNTANYASGAMYNNLAAPLQLRNCIVYGNNSGINNNSGTPAIQYSLVQGETSTANGNIDGSLDPVFVNQPTAGLNTGGNYRLQGCSPAINSGNSAFYNTGQTPDLSAITTDLNNTARAQGFSIDMGVYEFTGNPGGADLLAITGDAATKTISGSTTFTASSSACHLITTLQPTGGRFDNPLAGSVSTKVWVESSQPATYVKRHYEVNPAMYAHDAMGITTLYFTQAEFDAYNAVNTVKLPTSPGDISGKANLVIRQYAGYSILGTGQPNTYFSSSSTIIDPNNTDIIWNASASRWEVSFVFNGYSGFFVTSQLNALPLTLLNFNGRPYSGYNQLQWKTADETNTKEFILERSTDASTFTAIATIAAAGAGNNSYSFKDPISFSGKLYYRLKMVDVDGKYTYSAIVTMTNTGNNGASLYPNPVNDVAYLQTGNDLLQSKASVYHANGQFVQTIIITTTTQVIPMQQLTSGIYIIKLDNGIAMKFIKQ